MDHFTQQAILSSQLRRKRFAPAVKAFSMDGATDPFLLFRDGGLAAFGGIRYLRRIIEESTTVGELFAVCDRENNLSLTDLSFKQTPVSRSR